MVDERCVYENVLRDAGSLCVDIFRKLLTILMETSDQLNLPAERICGTVAQLFRWIAHGGEARVHSAFNMQVDIADVIKNQACEHGSRYKGLVEIDDFWDEKQLRTLKEAGWAAGHRHLVANDIAPLLERWMTKARKEIKEWKAQVFHSNFGFDNLITVGAFLQKMRIGIQEGEQLASELFCLVTPEASHFSEHRSSLRQRL